MWNTFVKQFEDFISDLNERSGKVGIILDNFPVDHVCYRVSNAENFKKVRDMLVQESHLYTKRVHHERTFYCFFLKTPLKYSNFSFYTVEFSEPGGSDTYNDGFQHIEILTGQNYSEITSLPDKIKELLFSGKFGDEQYLKWPDKVVLKITKTPQIVKALSEENTQIVVS